MKKIILTISLFITILGSGCTNTAPEEVVNPFFDENGNPTQETVEAMENEWCEYNKGRDFAEGRCN